MPSLVSALRYLFVLAVIIGFLHQLVSLSCGGQGGELQCQTVQTQAVTDGVHVLTCPDGTTLVSANCTGMDRYAYPVVAAEEGDPPNTARCRCSTQCDHTTLMIRCCTHVP